MKLYKSIIFMLSLSVAIVSCSDFLEQEPPSALTPESFYTTEGQAQAVANQFYQDVLPGHDSFYSYDNDTDVQANKTPNNRFDNSRWLTGQDNDNWSWGNIRNLNFMIERLETNLENGTLTGSEVNIKHYIGELYFFRAYEYFEMLLKFGDMPIVKEVLPDEESILVAANHREPCNEVARFIIEDLNTAYTNMKENFEGRHTRISRDVAQLFKSRVALYMGSWLTNFVGTPFVPNGEGWPGAEKNAGYTYSTGSIDAEAKWFFEQSVAAAEIVAEKYKSTLSINNGIIPQAEGESNPYLEIWGTTDCSNKPEVLLWREYSIALRLVNNVEVAAQYNNYGGYTRSMVEGYLMADGLPHYASGYTYDDTTIEKVATNRDPRLYVFLKKPGDINCFKNTGDVAGTHWTEIEPVPAMITAVIEGTYVSGYTIRKGMTFDRSNCRNRGNGENVCVVFRATEALLNYMEAQYMLTKDVNSGKIMEYWKKIREAAGFIGEAQNPQIAINATDISKEAADWGAWTAGRLLTDNALYNIRRERRCEMLSEKLRDFDLKRWRSFDQLISNPVHVEGFRVWNTPMAEWYPDAVTDGGINANMSSPELSDYYRPHEVNMVNNSFSDGLTWRMAHYLDPLPLKQFLLTSPDYASADQSTLYQNPYWPTTSGVPATE
ncbi:MAG: RagB/SusD family nutrient uptake outer membrane protein [Tannerellaceae bacterium]|nr:RagB/SusD family nutrient uptake outer membrane protein [Tannerellaceae bacterium]